MLESYFLAKKTDLSQISEKMYPKEPKNVIC